MHLYHLPAFVSSSPLHLFRPSSSPKKKPRRRLRLPYQPSACAISISQATEIARTYTGPPEEAPLLAKRLLNSIPSALEGTQEEDGRAIASLYEALQKAGALSSFGSAAVPQRDKTVSVQELTREIDFPISALTPNRSSVLGWQLAGVFAVSSVVTTTRLLGIEALARPILVAFGAFIGVDQLFLRGAMFESVYRAILPRYVEKVLKHETGHLLVAYLLGLPIRGYVLSAADALKARIPGQAGTLFFDGSLADEAMRGRITSKTISRHSMVLMAGISSEAMCFQEAEGGASDVTALLNLLTSISWTPDQVQSEARWAVLQSVKLLRHNLSAFEALAEAMKENRPLGDCIDCIERLAV